MAPEKNTSVKKELLNEFYEKLWEVNRRAASVIFNACRVERASIPFNDIPEAQQLYGYAHLMQTEGLYFTKELTQLIGWCNENFKEEE